MASKQSEQLVTYYKGVIGALAVNPEMPLDEMRALFEHMGDVTAEPGGVDYIETDAGGVPALWAVPKGSTQDRVLLCSHGGGYVTGSMFTHRKVYGHLAKAVGCRALIVNYGLAPENAHPGPVNDMANGVWMAAGPGDQAAAHRSDRRFSGRRAGDHDAAPRAGTGPAAAGGDDADLTMARHGRDWRQLRNQQGAGCPCHARNHPGNGLDVPGGEGRPEASVGQSAARRPARFAAGLYPGWRIRSVAGRQPCAWPKRCAKRTGR